MLEINVRKKKLEKDVTTKCYKKCQKKMLEKNVGKKCQKKMLEKM